MSDVEVRDGLCRSLAGFTRFGAAYWPGAHHFMLVEVRRDGRLTGDGWAVCACCVREAADRAQARLRDAASGPLLDVVGEAEPDATPCVICGDAT